MVSRTPSCRARGDRWRRRRPAPPGRAGRHRPSRPRGQQPAGAPAGPATIGARTRPGRGREQPHVPSRRPIITTPSPSQSPTICSQEYAARTPAPARPGARRRRRGRGARNRAPATDHGRVGGPVAGLSPIRVTRTKASQLPSRRPVRTAPPPGVPGSAQTRPVRSARTRTSGRPSPVRSWPDASSVASPHRRTTTRPAASPPSPSPGASTSRPAEVSTHRSPHRPRSRRPPRPPHARRGTTTRAGGTRERGRRPAGCDRGCRPGHRSTTSGRPSPVRSGTPVTSTAAANARPTGSGWPSAAGPRPGSTLDPAGVRGTHQHVPGTVAGQVAETGHPSEPPIPFRLPTARREARSGSPASGATAHRRAPAGPGAGRRSRSGAARARSMTAGSRRPGPDGRDPRVQVAPRAGRRAASR